MKRPLLAVALLYVGGILLASRLTLSPFLLLGVGLGLAALAAIWRPARPALLCVLIPLAAWTDYALRTCIISPHDLRALVGNEAALVTIRGSLEETPSLRIYEPDESPSWRTMARLKVIALQPNKGVWQPASGHLAITTSGRLTNFFGGQVVEVTGVLEQPKVAAAEGTFDYRAYLLEQGVHYRLKAASEKDWTVLASPAARPLSDRFREWARHALALGLPAEDESLRLEWALTLGWKTALTEEVSEPFIRAATYHIFAVDGLRMAIIFGILFSGLRAVGMSRAFCGATLIPLIWFYVALTGWPASAIRATVMLTVVIMGWVLKRPNDILNSLFAAALIILVWEPRQLFQAGFQLSFVVVLCIILVLPPLRAAWQRLWAPDPLVPQHLRPWWWQVLRPPGRYLGELGLTSFAAWIGSIPLVAYYFNLVTPVSTPANIVAVPLCGLVLMSNLAGLLFAAWCPWATELFNHAGWFLMELIRITSAWFASWPRAYFYSAAPGLLTSLVYYLVLLPVLTGWVFRRPMRPLRMFGIGLLGLVWLTYWWAGRSVTRMTILSLNGGYAIYSDFPGKKNDLLIDCGTTNAVQFLTKPFLRAQGVNRLPALLLSHGDLHQVGGALLMEQLFGADQILVSPLSFRSAAYKQTLTELKARSIPLRTISRGDTWAGWSVLHPDAGDSFAVADDKAIVLARKIFGQKMLLLSDLGRPGQEALLERASDLQADILIAGLPAKPEALSDGLLDAVQPRVIVVCDSEFPATARARPSLRDRLAQRHITVIYTRLTGAVTFEFARKSWELRTMSGLRMCEPVSRASVSSPGPGGVAIRER